MSQKHTESQAQRKEPSNGPFIGSIDNGTSSTRFILFDGKGKIVELAQKEFPNYHPKAGWAEHDPEEIYTYTKACIEEVVENLRAAGHASPLDLIRSVGITNQRETTVVWDKRTGKHLHNALVWLDTRTRDLVKELTDATPSKDANHWKDKCGLPLSTYFSAVKLRWLLDNVPDVKKVYDEGHLAFGTKFTGGVNGGVHYTDVTNASRTMLMNLKTLAWDDEICSFFRITKSILPQIKSSSEVYGVFADDICLKGVPIAGILGDQQAALVGQLCLQKGQLKNTYGTGCFMLCNTGTAPVISTHGLLTTVGFQLGADAPCYYALEGSIAIAGASVKWLRDNLGIIKSAKEVGELASKVADSGGVYFVPAFSGLFAPYWRDDAKGTIVGMTLFTKKEHICRATLEAVSFQTKDIMESMELDMKTPVSLLRVDGGMSNSEELMQIQTDIVGVDLDRPAMLETTALGAALAAGLAVKMWPSLDEFAAQSEAKRFSPHSTLAQRSAWHAGWKKAIENCPIDTWVTRENTLTALQKHALALPATAPKELPTNFFLIVYFLLLRFKDPSSPYLHRLPQQVDSVLGWDQDDIPFQVLASTGYGAVVQARLEAHQADFQTYLPVLSHLFPACTFSDYLWAHHCMLSRAMDVGVPVSQWVIVPIIDFANHSFTPNDRWEVVQDDSGTHMVLVANHDIACNDQVFITYGNKLTNWQLLFEHGFCVDTNPNLVIVFPPPLQNLLPDQDTQALVEKRMDLLSHFPREARNTISAPVGNETDLLNPTRGVLSDCYLATILACVIADLTGLPDAVSPRSFLAWISARADYDLVSLQAYAVLQDALADYIATVSQTLDDSIAMSPQLEVVEMFRKSEQRAATLAHACINGLTTSLVAKVEALLP
ncbi:hypothetical protein HDV03_003433 [Kappamyces sp. JEL0829]|nr:hypothetical protein HDV03_003433 [Kappamyces sp. JEL0829]